MLSRIEKNWPKILLGLILILAFFLRATALDRYTAGFTADEAAQGYTAYSILKTGKDEWGQFLPVNLRSFGDFKPPLQTYLMIPSVAVFGLNEFAVRLPNAILGILGVLGIYLLTKALLANSFHLGGVMASVSLQPATVRGVSLLAALLLAISPWHISLSRGAFEANLTTFLLPVGIWLFLKGLKEPKYLPLAGFFFGVNLFSYHAARLFTPLFLGVLGIWGRRRLRRVRRLRGGRREIILAGAVFVFFGLLAFWSTLKGSGTRAADIGIFSAGLQAPAIFLKQYFTYLSLSFFFTQGAGEATYGMIPGKGVLYLFELPFLIIAFWSLAHRWNNSFLPLLVWLLLAPIPASLSFGVGYHANRAAVMMPAIQILSAYGGVLLMQIAKTNLKPFVKRVFFVSLYLCIFVSLGGFLKTYFLDAPKINAPAMAYGWKEAAGYLETIEDQYQKLVISRRFSEPQAFIAFYRKWEPADFQKESGDWLRYQKEGLKFVDQLGNYHLGKYEFRNLNWNEDKNLTKTLLVGKPEDFPADTPIKKMIIFPDGERAFYIVEPKKI